MREIRSSGSVEGVVSNHDPYSDCPPRGAHLPEGCAGPLLPRAPVSIGAVAAGRSYWTAAVAARMSKRGTCSNTIHAIGLPQELTPTEENKGE
jgi:hypothetical protein